jgi:hypothetical protein
MKKAFSILLVLCLVFMVVGVGCKSKPATGVAPNTPEWWNDVRPPDDVLWGDGMARQSSASMSMNTSEALARVSIARQLDTMVKAMFTNYNLDAGNVNNQANASMQEDVSRQVTNMNVSGAIPIKRWQAPDGTYYSRMEFKKADARSTVASILGNQEAAYAQFKAQEALRFLDAELAKNQGTLQIDR